MRIEETRLKKIKQNKKHQLVFFSIEKTLLRVIIADAP
jgi:hypothetical protein